MKLLFKLLFLCMVGCSYGQYLDGAGALIREEEQVRAKRVLDRALETGRAYLRTEAATLAENNSRSRMLPNFAGLGMATIQYGEYEGMCKSYLNPLKKKACNNRLNYIKEAHRQVLALVSSPSLGAVDQGVKELIGEKYTHITNTLLAELEQMKWEADKNWFRHFIHTEKQ